MNHYETAMLLSPGLSDKDLGKFVKEAKELLAKHGATEIGPERTERRTLAYPVKKQREGTYVFVNFQAPTALPAKMKQELRHRDELLRLAFILKPDRAIRAEAEAAERASRNETPPTPPKPAVDIDQDFDDGPEPPDTE